MSTIQKPITNTGEAGRNSPAWVAYQNDRLHDLRAAMLELLDPAIPIAQAELVADWRRSCQDLGIALSRIEAASPAELLRQLEARGDSVRDMLLVDGERVKSIHWAARGYVSASVVKAQERRIARESAPKAELRDSPKRAARKSSEPVDLSKLQAVIDGIRSDLDRVEGQLRGLLAP